MAVRQYIGARYVTKIYENSNNPSSAEWEASVNYEPLTLVTYNNGSYLSKKEVPANVGDPATNPLYWVQTGFYNGQIANLQNQINSINATLLTINSGDWLNGKKVVAYGDSTIEEPSYLSIAASAAGFTLTNRQVSGSTMNSDTYSGVNLINASTDLNTFDYIFLCYGTNEWQNGRDIHDLVVDTDTLISAVLGKNPNLQIIFVLPPFSYHDWNNGFPANCNALGFSLEQVVNMIIEELEILTIPYIDFYHISSCNKYNYSYCLDGAGSIYVHPAEHFKNELAQIVLNGTTYDQKGEYHSILNSCDFVVATSRINATEYNNLVSVYNTGGLAYGMAMKINANETVSSQRKFFNTGRYIVRGHCTHPISINIDSNTYDATAGDFEFYVSPGYTFTDIKITAGTNGAIVNDFSVYRLDRFNDFETGYRFGGSIVPYLNDTDFTFPATPLIEYDRDGIFLDCWSATITPSDNGKTLFTLPADITIIQDTLIGIDFSSGETVAAYVTGQTVTCMTNVLSTKTFVFPSKLLRNMRQYDVKYSAN